MQFYGTIVFAGDDQRTLKCMTRTEYCEAAWQKFADLLGYHIGEGHHIHGPGNPDKNKLADFIDATGVVGFAKDLLPLYAKLLHVMRDNIAPSGGNNDVI